MSVRVSERACKKNVSNVCNWIAIASAALRWDCCDCESLRVDDCEGSVVDDDEGAAAGAAGAAAVSAAMADDAQRRRRL